MRNSADGCILFERMAKVEVRQNLILALVIIIGVFLGYITIKLMNTQIYLLTGERGLTSISTISHGDVNTLRDAVDKATER